MANFLGGLGRALSQMSPQQRASLLRTGASQASNPRSAVGLSQQANDVTDFELQRRRHEIDDRQLKARMDQDQSQWAERMGMERQKVRQEKEARLAAVMDQQNFQRGLVGYMGIMSDDSLNESSKNKAITELIAQNPSVKFQEFVASVAKKGPLVEVNTGVEKPPVGYFWNKDGDPSAGVSPIPGGPAQDVPAETAAKTSQFQSAQGQLPMIQERLFKPDGTPNRENIATMTAPLTGKAGIPFTAGREMATGFEQGIQAITRGETGAAMPPSELDNTRKRFQPSILDTDEQIRIKWQMYQDFINGALVLLKRGREGKPLPEFDENAFNEEMTKRMQGKPSDGTVDFGDWK